MIMNADNDLNMEAADVAEVQRAAALEEELESMGA